MAYRNTKPSLTDRERSGCVFIQQNFATLNEYFEVNHNPINLQPPGHKFLEFYPIADPATAADQLELYGRTGVYGALNTIELCMRRPSNGDINEFTSSQTGDEGWYQLPSGILIKWKWNEPIAAASSGIQTFTWNNAANFPAFSAIYQVFVWASPDAAATDPNVQLYEYDETVTQVQWTGWNRDTPGVVGPAIVTNAYKVNIIAIGKGPGV